MRHKYIGGTILKPLVPIQPNIGLDSDARDAVIEILNTILADEKVLTMKTQNAHWHVRGPGFLDFRSLFEQQIHLLNKISDELAERANMMGGSAIGSFEEFLGYTRLKEQSGKAPGIMELLADQEAAIRFMREDARKCTEEYEDHGTFALLVRFIRSHEKMAWILRSYIEPDLILDTGQEAKGRPAVG
jgi:starvation-inducible DNA-binding protein